MIRVTEQLHFFQGNDPVRLAQEYGTPVYVYNERILRERCREMKGLVDYPGFRVNYSAKANSNPALLQIVRQEGLDVDAMSPGEIQAELLAGFDPSQILYISNNVSREEMQFAIDRGICVSVDSLSQLDQYGQINPGGRVAIRFNPGVGAGHHDKVVTGGKKTKFGVNAEYIPDVKAILAKYNLRLVGIDQHIGSLFMDGAQYIEGASNLLTIARQFEGLEFIDLGGGFGIPYYKEDGEPRLDLAGLGRRLTEYINHFVREYGRELLVKIEPGRYIAAECGVLLGGIHAVKYNGEDKYIGTDIGMNVLARPVLYDSYHGIEVYAKDGGSLEQEQEIATIVGNICESGDILAKGRMLPKGKPGDIIGVLDAGAYGSVMSGNYNNRLRAAEILIREDNSVRLIRRRDTLEDIMRPYEGLLQREWETPTMM